MSTTPEVTESDVTEDAIGQPGDAAGQPGDAAGQPGDAPNATDETPDTADAEDTFSREYVENLRTENAKLRVRAQNADDTRHRLHRALIELDGRLADAEDLPYSDDHLEPEAITTAITDLLADKPHLKNRTPRGDVGQGSRGVGQPASLLGILRSFA